MRAECSIAASAVLAVAGSRSRTRPAAAACRVTTLSACPTESCSSRASRLRSASVRACSSAAASRSAGVGPSRTGASRASSLPAPAARATSAPSSTSPPTAHPTAFHPGVTTKPSTGVDRPVTGSTSVNSVNGTIASVQPLTTPPTARCSVNQAAVRRRSCQDRPACRGGVSTRAPSRPCAAFTDSPRTGRNSPVAATTGSTAANTPAWTGSSRLADSPLTRPETSTPTIMYGISSAPPRTRHAQRRGRVLLTSEIVCR
ncbi:hypothetical protein ACFQ0B_57355 [Nonomuraea thailandensis]